MNLSFAQPYWLAAAAMVLPIVYLGWRRERVRMASARFHRSSVASLVLSHGPSALIALAIVLGAVTLAQPQVTVNDQSVSTLPGRDIIFALDYSASMGAKYKGDQEPVTRNWWNEEKSKEGADPQPDATAGGEGGESTEQEWRRIDAAQQAILGFVETRREAKGGDAIGLIAFDYRPILRWPLDHDLKQISRHGSFIPAGKGPQGLGQGTNFGHENPGPIDLAASHFEGKGQSTTRVLVLVTDGEDKLAADVLARLEKVIRKAGMKLYVIGIGEKIGTGELDIEKLCTSVNGKVFRAETQSQLDKCFEDINSLESSPVPVTNFKSLEPVFPIFLTVALILFVLGVLSESLILGR